MHNPKLPLSRHTCIEAGDGVEVHSCRNERIMPWPFYTSSPSASISARSLSLPVARLLATRVARPSCSASAASNLALYPGVPSRLEILDSGKAQVSRSMRLGGSPI